MTSQKVYLIPWDPSSEEQYQRMQDQRLSCGLRVDEVPAWKDKHLKGVKTMYWVVLSDGFADKDKLLAEHAAKYPLVRTFPGPDRTQYLLAWLIDES